MLCILQYGTRTQYPITLNLCTILLVLSHLMLLLSPINVVNSTVKRYLCYGHFDGPVPAYQMHLAVALPNVDVDVIKVEAYYILYTIYINKFPRCLTPMTLSNSGV